VNNLGKKYLGLIAASALVVLMVQPAAALIKQSRWAYDVSPNAYLAVKVVAAAVRMALAQL
jgi:hypothetical protein